MKLISLGTSEIQLELTNEQKRKAMQALSLHHLGNIHANEYRNGKCVPKYPERETPEFVDAAYSMPRNLSVNADLFFDPQTGLKSFTVYFVQSTPAYQGQCTHFVSLELEKAESAAVTLMRSGEERLWKYHEFEVVAVPLNQVNEDSLPEWSVISFYHPKPLSGRRQLQWDSVEIAPSIWRSTPKDLEVRE